MIDISKNLSLEQRTANLIELANNCLVVARDNINSMSEKKQNDFQQLIDETLIEFISIEFLKNE